MASKHTDNGNGGAAVAVDDPAKVRNIVLVGPSGSGKTTLTEALLTAAGVMTRAGSVTDGTTVCDHDPAAQRQQRSVGLSVAPLVHEDVKINLIDTPGYADFVGEVRAGLRAADAALFVVCAAEGVDPATIALWEECAAVGMPRAVVIARLDHQRADVAAEMAACQEAFGAGVLPLYLPASGRPGLVGLITQRLFDYSSGLPADDRRTRRGRPGHHGRRPQRADRGDHRRERGRDPHGALPRGRGHRPRHPDRRPRDGRRARLVPPGDPRLLGHRRRAGRVARGVDRRVPVAAWSTPFPRSPIRTAASAVPVGGRPRRSAGGRGRAHRHRLLRRARVTRPGVLRDAAAGAAGAHLRARHGRPRSRGPRRGRAGGAHLLASGVRPCARCRTAWPATSAR